MDEITLLQFAQKVKQMRHAQKRCEHFSREDLHDLKKKHETEVDAILEELFDTQLLIPHFAN